MVKTYKRNSFGRMTWVWYERPWFWQIIALVVVVVGLVIRYVGLALTGLGLELSGVSFCLACTDWGGIGGICWSYVVAGFGAD